MNLPKKYESLITAARKAAGNSYSPYSKFKVGAAVLTERGKVFTGTNVENSSYGLTICAERAALVNAVAGGHRKFKAVAVVSGSKDACMPCGACLQFMSEFGADIQIIYKDKSGGYAQKPIRELLPEAFKLKK